MEVLIKRFVIDGCYFLVFVQESNQRKRLGGGVEAAVYRCFLNYPTLLPRLRATLPPVPLPGLDGSWAMVEITDFVDCAHMLQELSSEVFPFKEKDGTLFL